eukprot:3761556-Pyramimonas_sp.AAC.1
MKWGQTYRVGDAAVVVVLYDLITCLRHAALHNLRFSWRVLSAAGVVADNAIVGHLSWLPGFIVASVLPTSRARVTARPSASNVASWAGTAA